MHCLICALQDMHRFLPPSASACVVTEVANEQPQVGPSNISTCDFIQVHASLAPLPSCRHSACRHIGSGFIRIGDALQGAGEAVGRFFGSIGHAVHSKL